MNGGVERPCVYRNAKSKEKSGLPHPCRVFGDRVGISRFHEGRDDLGFSLPEQSRRVPKNVASDGFSRCVISSTPLTRDSISSTLSSRAQQFIAIAMNCEV